MRKLFLVCILVFLLVLSAFAFAKEQAETAPEKEGFWAKITSFFKPKSEPAYVEDVPPEEGGEPGKPEEPTEVTAEAEPAPPTRLDQPAEEEEKKPAEVIKGVAEPAIAVSTVSKPVPKENCCADECKVVICVNKYQQEIFCPKSYDWCQKMYGNCRVIGCDPPTVQPYVCPECICEEKPVPITPVIVPEEKCKEKKHTCKKVSKVTTAAGAAAQTVELITCEGGYEDCVAMYGSCYCGVKDETQPTITTTTTTTEIVEVEYCCCKFESAAATAAVQEVYYKMFPEDECENCVSDSYCQTATTSSGGGGGGGSASTGATNG